MSHTGVILVSYCETDRTKCPHKQNHAEKNHKHYRNILKQLLRPGSRFKMFGGRRLLDGTLAPSPGSWLLLRFFWGSVGGSGGFTCR